MKHYLLLLLVTFAFAGCMQSENSNQLWPEITSQHKPWTRWWWMGNAVDEHNLDTLLRQYADAGFGGVEITPIYGAKGYEDKYLPYLSPEWMAMLKHTVASASKYGMQVDINLGTGWPFGGPQITTEHSATRLIIRQFEVKKGEKLSGKIEPAEVRQRNRETKLQTLTGYGPDNLILDLTNFVTSDGTLDWKAEEGDWTLYAAFSARTMQMVKRAAPGGEGLTFDHFSKPALDVYLKRFDKAFNGSNQGIRAFFNDSYEVYGTNWTDNFFDEFERRRGYNLQYHLRELAQLPPLDELSKRVHSDYRETISDLLLENFTKPWSEWAHQYQSLTRNQAHGSPGNLLDLYAAVDIPECETFGSSYFTIPGLRRDSADVRNVDPDPVMMKFATSAANVAGKNLVSSETFTWLGEHFKTSLAQCKPELEQVFLSGVNHIFYHGTTYSPTEADWPGWLFYASVNFNPSNSFWAHLPAFNNYVARCQSILQSGNPDNEILVYWPIHDYWMTTTNTNIMLTIHDIDKWLHPSGFYKTTQLLTSEGYSYDFISDRLLETFSVVNNQLVTERGTTYKALVFPPLTYIPEKTLEKAIELSEKGAHIIFANLPADIPGANNVINRRELLLNLTTKMVNQTNPVVVTDNITGALQSKSIYPESVSKTGLKFLRRKTPKGTYYYLVNHSPEIVDQYIELNQSANIYYLLDPLSGKAGVASTKKHNGKQSVRVKLQSGETVFVYVSDQRFGLHDWNYTDISGEKIEISGSWNIRFTSGGPELPASGNMEKLLPWTEFSDPKALNFAGTATYSTAFNLPESTVHNYLLDLGKVYESAKVWINGEEAGYIWSHPFTIDISHLLKSGENLLEIEVANLSANRIRWMDQQGIIWRNYHEINFVNINYKPFDASGWDVMPSGLEGPVTLFKY
jgi:hypothetical protein